MFITIGKYSVKLQGFDHEDIETLAAMFYWVIQERPPCDSSVVCTIHAGTVPPPDVGCDAQTIVLEYSEKVIVIKNGRTIYEFPGTGGAAEVSPENGVCVLDNPSQRRRCIDLYRLIRAFILKEAFEAGWVVFHAACIVVDGRAVLISGPKGVGKTTLSAQLCTRIQHAKLLSNDKTLVHADGKVMHFPEAPAVSIETIHSFGQIEKRWQRMKTTLKPGSKLFNEHPPLPDFLRLYSLPSSTKVIFSETEWLSFLGEEGCNRAVLKKILLIESDRVPLGIEYEASNEDLANCRDCLVNHNNWIGSKIWPMQNNLCEDIKTEVPVQRIKVPGNIKMAIDFVSSIVKKSVR